MARYSKEQRRRAAELYERYEHSAADVIRELGYPSKEALRMWHRDWLEERRTGIPSSRGEHYSRYTDGQRRAAVEHYLTHGRRLSRTIRQMGYPSREAPAAPNNTAAGLQPQYPWPSTAIIGGLQTIKYSPNGVSQP